MIKRLFAAGALTLLVLPLACGPTSGSDGTGGAASDSTDAEPTPTHTPWPTKPTSTPATPLPTKPPLQTPTPEPTWSPPSAHPEGLAGCKKLSAFGPPDEIKYIPWCGEELVDRVDTTCSGESTDAAIQTCAENIVSEYRATSFRHGPAKCAAYDTGSQRKQSCLTRSSDDVDKQTHKMIEAWEKVKADGDEDDDVVSAMKDTVTCLEDLGHDDVDTALLFGWQRLETHHDLKDREAGLTQKQKELRDELLEPSQSCAKKNGLFDAQDTAWAAELQRLHDDEPETVQALIDAGLLEILQKPGVEHFLTGERPSS